MPKPLSLPFDPIARADELWQQRWGPVPSMAAITSIMRAHQILLAEVDAVVKPYGLTFARYEALVLLTFSKAGELPMSKIGERLMVHPTSVTNTVDRLVRSGLVDKRPNPNDGRGTLASITDKGREVVEAATRDLMAMDFGLGAYDAEECGEIFAMLRPLRVAAHDFDEGLSRARPAARSPGARGYARRHERERADPLPGRWPTSPPCAAGPCTSAWSPSTASTWRRHHASPSRRSRTAVLYIIYLVFAFDLGSKAKWPFGKLLWVLLAGTIPSAAFFVERKITREVEPQVTEAAPVTAKA